eukprot:CAMPEP_0185602860 /NCGR_PEP_ID=MMETSP0436-20130131/2058_1 /TAXON_ID=626734 ORGANISM="Favella taraikaensis, Strain Fe Narragansett Bay" /NCGR_SAMPLE_ID=MMETSP0436 /ASSEMBLY_ACC=CAM_ASM_000390 /LENGTH=58 /DNA_ID=CAMNT_0028233171 /DNA_START=2251 /DNA_END=2427 /DNA_ORIENTATION=-
MMLFKSQVTRVQDGTGTGSQQRTNSVDNTVGTGQAQQQPYLVLENKSEFNGISNISNH